MCSFERRKGDGYATRILGSEGSKDEVVGVNGFGSRFW